MNGLRMAMMKARTLLDYSAKDKAMCQLLEKRNLLGRTRINWAVRTEVKKRMKRI